MEVDLLIIVWQKYLLKVFCILILPLVMGFRKYITAFMLVCIPLMVVSQDKGITEKDQMKIQAKKEKEKTKNAKQAEKEMNKRHLDIQDKKTRKRLKKNQKKSQNQSHNNREAFWSGWFSRKR